MNTLTPPAHVRQAEDLETCLANAQSHAKRIVKDAVAAGEWLIKAKAACPHGQWLPALEKYGFTPRTAQRLMEAARSKYDTVSYLLDSSEWLDVWRAAGENPLTLDGLRQVVADHYGHLPEHEDGWWDSLHLKVLAGAAAKYRIRTGELLPLPPLARAAPPSEHETRIAEYQLHVMKETGYIVRLCKALGICREKSGRLKFQPIVLENLTPEALQAAVMLEINNGGDVYDDERLARMFDVDVADLTEALRGWALGIECWLWNWAEPEPANA